MHPSADSRRLTALYQACIDEAARQGGLLIETLIDYARYHLRQRESELRQFDERNAVSEALRLLSQHQAPMVAAFPGALRAGFAAPASQLAEPVPALASLRFDQLELMDDGQVQDRIELARAQQMTAHAVEAALAELNTLVCAAQNLPNVQPDRNPFRPEVYLRALQEVVLGSGVAAPVRQAWMLHMCAVLGKELDVFYRRMVADLRTQGVQPVGYLVAGQGESLGGRPRYRPEVLTPMAPSAQAQVRPMAEPVAARAPVPAAVPARPATPPPLYLDDVPPTPSAPAVPAVSRDDTGHAVLTVSSLRELLAREAAPAGDGASRLQAFAARFAQQFEGAGAEEDPPHTDFQSTLPAAFDALDDPTQVERVLQRMAERQGAAEESRRSHLRRQLRQDAAGTQQAVAREVVALMVENIAYDERLLPAVRAAVQALEPVLMQLVAVDPRFFSDRGHPARQLLDEVTERSLAWESESAPGCAAFLNPVREVVALLAQAPIADAGPFAVALTELRRAWRENQQAEARQREQAVQALLQAEQRNLLADRLRMELGALPEAEGVAGEVLAFLLGPWAQVLAQARLADQVGEVDPGGYRGLVETLLWSARPELAAQNPARLTRLIPGLLAKLREGLKTIDYPPLQTSGFLERLMVLHQSAYRRPQAPAALAAAQAASPEAVAPSRGASEPAPAPAPAPVPAAPEDAWLAPREARASGFMALGGTVNGERGAAEVPALAPVPGAGAGLQLDMGAWVELLSEGAWIRTQLTWASPHGTLFLFTRADGSTRSMTRRMRDRLLADGHLRVVSAQPVVAGALDAVAQAALRNSLDEESPR